MNDMPEISVVISTYCRNHGDTQCANFLKRALQSILSQTFSNFELILLDDGSTDGSAQVCQTYAERDSRIRYIRCDHNSGLPAKRYNQGISLAKGKWVAFMFDDDEWLPNALEDLYQSTIHLPSIYGMINGTVEYITIQNEINEVMLTDLGMESSKFIKLFANNRLANNSVLVRREVFDLVGGYDETPCMRRLCDWDLWIRIGMQYKIKPIPKRVARLYEGLPDSLLRTSIINYRLVYARQLLFFRKQPLRKYSFRMSSEQWKHFLTILALMPLYWSYRLTHLAINKTKGIQRFLPKPLIKVLKTIVQGIEKRI